MNELEATYFFARFSIKLSLNELKDPTYSVLSQILYQNNGGKRQRFWLLKLQLCHDSVLQPKLSLDHDS